VLKKQGFGFDRDEIRRWYNGYNWLEFSKENRNIVGFEVERFR